MLKQCSRYYTELPQNGYTWIWQNLNKDWKQRYRLMTVWCITLGNENLKLGGELRMLASFKSTLMFELLNQTKGVIITCCRMRQIIMIQSNCLKRFTKQNFWDNESCYLLLVFVSNDCFNIPAYHATKSQKWEQISYLHQLNTNHCLW